MRARGRKPRRIIPTNDYQTFIAKSRYAKYSTVKGREDWGETVERYMDNVVRPKLVTIPMSTN